MLLIDTVGSKRPSFLREDVCCMAITVLFSQGYDSQWKARVAAAYCRHGSKDPAYYSSKTQREGCAGVQTGRGDAVIR